MNKLNLTPIPLEFMPKGHVHKLSGKRIPGVTTVSAFFEDDGWKFAWPVKIMEEKILQRLEEVAEMFDGQNRRKQVYLEDAIRVTQECKNSWREKRDKSATQGTNAHDWISSWVKNQIESTPSGISSVFLADKEEQNCIDSFLAWEKSIKPEWMASEVQVGSMTHQFAGILDAAAIINGKKVLVDFKTGDKVKLKDMKGNEFIKYSIVAQLAGLQLCLEEQGFVPDERAILHLPKEGKYEYVPVCTDVVQDQKDFLNALTFYRSKNLFQGRNKRIWVDHKPADPELETDEPLLEEIK